MRAALSVRCRKTGRLNWLLIGNLAQEHGQLATSAVLPHTGRTVLHIAVSEGWKELGLFLHRGASVHASDALGLTPLSLALVRGNLHAAELLLRWGAGSIDLVLEMQLAAGISTLVGDRKLVLLLERFIFEHKGRDHPVSSTEYMLARKPLHGLR